MHGDVKNAIRGACKVEQFGLCAFCCAQLPQVLELQRIAHVEPRSKNTSAILDFSNMVTSCSSGRETDGNAYVAQIEKSCDEAQENDELPVNPLQPDCEERFGYLGNGAIVAAQSGDQAAAASIDILNLDCDRLRAGRLAVMEAAESDLELMTPEEWVAEYLQPRNGVLVDFAPAVRNLAP